MKQLVFQLKNLFSWSHKCIQSWVDDSSEHKKVKGVDRNVVAALRHMYKDVLLNQKCLRHSMNGIQSKNHRKGTYEINKISLFYLDDKIYIQNNGYDVLGLGCQS